MIEREAYLLRYTQECKEREDISKKKRVRETTSDNMLQIQDSKLVGIQVCATQQVVVEIREDVKN